MEHQPDVRRQRILDEWDDLEKEEGELIASIAGHQTAMEEDSGRLKTLQDYMTIFKVFNFAQPEEYEPQFSFEPSGPCPLTMDQLREAGGYQSALAALGNALPGGYIHGRTAGQWLIDAGALEGLSTDEARMRVNKFMSRSRQWEVLAGNRGWFRYLPERGPESMSDAIGTDGNTAEQNP